MQYLLTQEEYDALKNSQPTREAVEKEVRKRLVDAAPQFIRDVERATFSGLSRVDVSHACRKLLGAAFPAKLPESPGCTHGVPFGVQCVECERL